MNITIPNQLGGSSNYKVGKNMIYSTFWLVQIKLKLKVLNKIKIEYMKCDSSNKKRNDGITKMDGQESFASKNSLGGS